MWLTCLCQAYLLAGIVVVYCNNRGGVVLALPAQKNIIQVV